MKNTLAGIVAGTILGAGGAMGADKLNKVEPVDAIQEAQTAYFEKHGTYAQVSVYETPSKEKGYQVEYEDDKGIYYVGFGPEAMSRTKEILKEQVTASST